MTTSFDICPRCGTKQQPKTITDEKFDWIFSKPRNVGYRQGFGCDNRQCCFDYVNGVGAYQFNIPEDYVVVSHPETQLSYIHLIKTFETSSLLLPHPHSIYAWTNSNGSIGYPHIGTIVKLHMAIPITTTKDELEKILLLS